MSNLQRGALLYLGLIVFIVLIGWWQGTANISLLL
jgi:hypothetical protein